MALRPASTAPVGKMAATVIVFAVLLLVALPAHFRSRREARQRKVIRYIMSFQAAEARYQNDSPALRFFSGVSEAEREGFPWRDEIEGYRLIYLVDKSRTRFCLVAVPGPDSSDTTAFMGDESGTIYLCEMTPSLLKEYDPDLIGDAVKFGAPPEKRLPGDWLPK